MRIRKQETKLRTEQRFLPLSLGQDGERIGPATIKKQAYYGLLLFKKVRENIKEEN